MHVMCTMYVPGTHTTEGVESSGTGIMNDCEPLCRSWESNWIVLKISKCSK